VARNGAEALAWKDITLGQEFLEVTLTVPEPEAADFLVVRIYAPDGSALSGVQIQAQAMNSAGPTRTQRFLNVLRRPDGTCWVRRFVPNPKTDGQAAWYYQLSASHSTYGNLTFKLDNTTAGEVTLRFVEPCVLTISVPGAASAAQRKNLRFALALEVEPSSWNGVSPDGQRSGDGLPENDTLVYSKLTPGHYRFTLSVSSGEPDEGYFDRAELASWDFDVVSGPSTQTCPVPKYYTVTLDVPDAATVGNISFRTVDGKSVRQTRGATTARVIFRGITAGEWIVETRTGSMRLQVSGDTEITLAVQPFDCLKLSGIKAGGAIETMGLRNGDLLIAVDSEGADTTELLQLKVQGSYAKESSTWTVIRNGAQQNVVVNGKELLRLMSLNGDERERVSLRPARRD
jgi:hypothetical protein